LAVSLQRDVDQVEPRRKKTTWGLGCQQRHLLQHETASKVRGEFLCVTTNNNKQQICKSAAWNNNNQPKMTDKKKDAAAMTSPSRRRRMTLPPAAMKRSTGSACQRKIHGQVRHNSLPRAL
jgi:hypothetical protein